MEGIEKLPERIILWNNVKMEWANNNATGAENYYIHSQFCLHTKHLLRIKFPREGNSRHQFPPKSMRPALYS